MSNATPFVPSSPVRPARLALSIDAGSSGVIDIHDLRAEPLPLSLSPSQPEPHPSPPPRSPRPWWARLAVGSALTMSMAMMGVALAARPADPAASTDTMVMDRAVRWDGQLALYDASHDPGGLATTREPADRLAAPRSASESQPDAEPDAAAGLDADADAEAPVPIEREAVAEPEPEAASKATKTRRSRARPAPSKAFEPKPKPASKPEPKPEGGSIPIECVLDPARCDRSGAAAEPPRTGGSSRPAPLPAKLSIGQLKQALATTKADARRCGPEHGVDPGTTVRVRLSIEGTSGDVLSATPQGEHARGSLGQCVARALGQTQFPRFASPRMGTLYSVRL